MNASVAENDPIRDALDRAIGFQYEIIRLLGRGGMGAVYHAHERALDRPVAIKVLPPDVAGTADARERFLREARTAARLTHPNIVPLFTFGETAGLIYFVMGYVDGESLEQRIRSLGPMDVADATPILEQLASAIAYAHQQGIIHRDVKPDNVLIERSTGSAKLTDFGIAKQSSGGETLTGTGMVLGTPRYMSPEQASGDQLDARSDIYSLGLVGHALLTGRPPFDGASVQEILVQQVTREVPSLRSILPNAPSTICRAIDRAVVKDPKRRWQSASEMSDALVVEEDDEEPSAFGQSLRRPGVYALTSMAGTILVLNGAWWIGTNPNEGWLNVPTVVLMLWPLVTLADFATAKWKDKRSPEELRRIFTEPPRWWPFWWPARWRRRDDAWSRLPAAVRSIRVTGSAGVGLFLVGLELAFLATTGREVLPKSISVGGAITASIIFAASLVTLAISAARGWLWGRKLGLTPQDANRVMSAPTARPRFWSKPHIAALLSPREEHPGLLEPRSAAEAADAIAAAHQQLPMGQRDALGDVGIAARRLARTIEALDNEIALLAREGDSAEADRLAGRLAALGPETPSDSDGKREMRRLYASQLELLRRLGRQLEELGSRRKRYAELLRTLWLQLAVLRAQLSTDAARSETTDQIRGICRSIDREIEGVHEAAIALGEARPS